jgi:hypothetical protein
MLRIKKKRKAAKDKRPECGQSGGGEVGGGGLLSGSLVACKEVKSVVFVKWSGT